MKKRISFLLALLLLVHIGLLSGCQTAPIETEDKPTTSTTEKSDYAPSEALDGKDVVAKNSRYTLLYDPITTAITVKDNQSGAAFSSSPNESEYPSVSNIAAITNQIKSALVLYYYSGTEPKTLYSFPDCVSKNQFKVYSIEDGIRVEYTIGEPQSFEVFPIALTAKYVEEELLPKFSEEESKLFERYYKRYTYSELSDSERVEHQKKYPNFAQHDFYQRFDTDRIPVRYRNVIQTALMNASLTMEVMKREYDLLGYEYELSEAPSFFMPVEYRLREDSLEATVCADEIQYSETFRLTSFDFLPFFGGCGAREDGYMLIPDGSGILVDLDNNTNVPISLPVYAQEMNTEYSALTDTFKTEQCFLPVFGSKQGENSFFTVLSDGAAQASINMTTANTLTKLNRVYATYLMQERQSFSPEGWKNNWTFTNYSPKGYDGKITQNIYLLSGENAGYEGMAALYRELLFQGREKQDSTPTFYLETYGEILRNTVTIGIAGYKSGVFTTVDQLGQMIDSLNKSGITNVNAVYRNWAYDPTFGQTVIGKDPNGNVGSFGQLGGLMKRKNTQLVPEFNVMYTADAPSVFSSLNLRSCAAYSIQNNYLSIRLSSLDKTSEKSRYAYNANGISNAMQMIADTVNGLGSQSLLVADVGTDLYSDFNKDKTMMRDEMKDKIAASYASLSEKSKLMIDGANSYLLPYTDTTLNIPLGGSNFYACNREVPFLQMVLQGYVNYTGESINLSHNKREQFLKSLEFGAVPFFTLNWADATILKDSNYSYLSGTRFSYNETAAVEMFREYQTLFPVVSSGIVTHTTLSETLAKTEFSAGTLILNYSDKEQTVDGVTVPAQGYQVVKGVK
ncbi:MAG: hypothetical protein IJD11_02420 [Oscillospiraceae bacterium]|nr:hypothetical protein [Oscillospiraceae bacterium]